ncbi:hypothetical protein L218DRAFT_1081139 [Marasmius fiardii PR-910]|nr:hypothetical protein L218DRAFT_1081139 [Marasmius fiardii PR-910]
MVHTCSQTASQAVLPSEEAVTIKVNYSLWRTGDESLSWFYFKLTNQQLSSELKAVRNAILFQLNEDFDHQFRKKSIADFHFLIPKDLLGGERTFPWALPEDWMELFQPLQPSFVLKEHIKNLNKSDVLHLVIKPKGQSHDHESELEDAGDSRKPLYISPSFTELFDFDGRLSGAMDQQEAKIKSPSQGAQASLYVNIQKDEAQVVCNGHHAFGGDDTSSPPLTIFHPIFQKFLCEVSSDSIPPPEYIKKVVALMEDACVIKTMDGGCKEPYYSKDMRPLIGGVCNATMTKCSNRSDCKADGVCIFHDILVLSWENKRGIGTTAADVLVQVVLSMKKLLSEAPEKIFRKCNCPTFMIVTCGSWLCILGGVYADRVIVQHLTPLIPLVFSESASTVCQSVVAKVMYSLSRTIKALKKFYKQAPFQYLEPFDPKNQTQATQPHPRNYPYPNTYKAHNSNASIMFTYKRALQPTFQCVTFLTKENVSKDLVVVKFVDQTSYGSAVHQFLAEEGFAPKICYHGPLPSSTVYQEPPPDFVMASPHTSPPTHISSSLPGMYMVVMDYIECGTRPLVAGADDAGRQVGRILNMLHEKGYVFGDLRNPNIVFNDGKAMLIDFDWTGKFDQASPTSRSSDCTDIAHYPYRSNEGQRWLLTPAHELGGMPILLGDDDFMLEEWVKRLKGKD